MGSKNTPNSKDKRFEHKLTLFGFLKNKISYFPSASHVNVTRFKDFRYLHWKTKILTKDIFAVYATFNAVKFCFDFRPF